ncbi:helix-turn-helix domain-containing protein [Mesorhizobium sp. VNQ89]|uniref:helix-turn-helix domain-containing protein n=1 Tax=Mesorhizobium quangtriensis TaxID=3157709 RepID=UPI0032B8750D
MQQRLSVKTNEEFEPTRISWREIDGLVHPATTARREEQAMELCEAVIDITAALFNVSSKDLRKSGRSTLSVSRVRQVAMYVSHVVLRLNMADIGKAFGRDRTTVLYACHLVEDLRDDDDFDRIITMTERVVAAAFGERAGC